MNLNVEYSQRQSQLDSKTFAKKHQILMKLTKHNVMRCIASFCGSFSMHAFQELTF